LLLFAIFIKRFKLAAFEDSKSEWSLYIAINYGYRFILTSSK
jgi:hypothetical protein